ncbi:MAG TPA: tRNA (adenosine(37)-N6)-threonylcarbamoyltransferase complex dimerization subunit type 1 TsaB, partial [Abditibacteriaceae bacterium]
MKILALETSGAQIGLAALQTEPGALAHPVAVLASAEPRQISRQLISGIDATLGRAAWTLDDVDALAIGLGPGSWTSLRIALSTAKTLAQARGWRFAGVPTFDAMAAAVWRSALQARMSQNTMGTELPDRFLMLASAPSRAGEVYAKLYECTPEYLVVVQ